MGLKTGLDIITVARSTLQDQEPQAYRYTDAQLVDAINITLFEIRVLRPDAYLGQLSLPVYQYTVPTLSDVIPVSDFFYPAICNYVTGYPELRDDEFAVDGRAIALLNMFRKQITGGV